MAKKTTKKTKPATGWAIVDPSGVIVVASVRSIRWDCQHCWSAGGEWAVWSKLGYTCQHVEIRVVEIRVDD